MGREIAQRQDRLGRACMISYYFDRRAPPCSIMVDARHRRFTFEGIPGTVELERVHRAMCVQLGGRVFVADAPIPSALLRRTAIPATLTQVRNLGDAVLRAQGRTRTRG